MNMLIFTREVNSLGRLKGITPTAVPQFEIMYHLTLSLMIKLIDW